METIYEKLVFSQDREEVKQHIKNNMHDPDKQRVLHLLSPELWDKLQDIFQKNYDELLKDSEEAIKQECATKEQADLLTDYLIEFLEEDYPDLESNPFIFLHNFLNIRDNLTDFKENPSEGDYHYYQGINLKRFLPFNPSAAYQVNNNNQLEDGLEIYLPSRNAQFQFIKDLLQKTASELQQGFDSGTGAPTDEETLQELRDIINKILPSLSHI